MHHRPLLNLMQKKARFAKALIRPTVSFLTDGLLLLFIRLSIIYFISCSFEKAIRRLRVGGVP